MTQRRALQIAAALAAVGVALALVLARQHAYAHAGGQSFCSINDVVNCDRVATSRYSVVLGVPVALWGALGYGLALLLAAASLRRSRPHPRWATGLLFALAAAATAIDVALALISTFAVGALCLLCAGTWVISVGLLAAAWRATKPDGPLAALRADLSVLRSRPSRTAGVVLAGAAATALAAGAYQRYAPAPRPPEARRTPLPGQAAGAPPSAASGGPVVVVEFSDYDCPFCAISHEETKALLAARPDVKLVKKHFPLDPSCNAAVQRAMHPNACVLAAAAICAEEQGKLEPMDDLLFREQRARRPLEAVASELKLDLPRFRECLGAPSTARRLQADVAAALAVGVRATPTYVVNGVVVQGKLGPEALPPPPSRAARSP
jgi:protein-disulfide isomerase